MTENHIPAWARNYHSLGCSVFRLAEREKFPRGQTWKQHQTTRPSLEQINIWWDAIPLANIGIATGQISGGLFVIDIDVGPGKEGQDTLEALEKLYDELPETWEARTGGGGRHLYFRAPPGVILPNRKDFFGPNLDVRGDGGLVVGVGSIHPNGRPYTWKERYSPDVFINEAGEKNCELAPAWVLDVLKDTAMREVLHEKALRAGLTVTDGMGSETIKRDEWGAVVDGRKTYMHRLIYSTVMDLLDDGVVAEPDQIFDVVWPIYMKHAKPRTKTLEAEGVGQTLMREKVKYMFLPHRMKIHEAKAEANRVAKAQKQGAQGIQPQTETLAPTPGNDAVQAPQALQETARTDTNNSVCAVSEIPVFGDGVEIITPADFPPGPPPEQTWLVKDWIAEGITSAIYGAGGVGKSFVMQQLAYCLATRTEWCGLTIPQDGPPIKSLMIMGEDDRNQIHARSYSMIKALDMGDRMETLREAVHMVPMVGNDIALARFDRDGIMITTPFYEVVKQRVILGGYDLLSLDTIADIFTGNENDRTQVTQFVKVCIGGLQKARLEATGQPLNVMLVGHPPKGGTGFSGSTAWNGSVRARLEFAADEEIDGMRRLSLPKSNYSAANESGVPVVMDGAALPVRLPGQAEAASLENRIVEIVRAAAASGFPFQDKPRHDRGIAPNVLAALTDAQANYSKHHALAVMKRMVTDAREGMGPLRILKKNAANDQPAGFVVSKSWER